MNIETGSDTSWRATRDRALEAVTSPRVGALSGPLRTMVGPLLKRTFRVRVEGVDNFPVDGPVILSPNHRSFFDSPLLMALAPRPVIFLGKAEYMDQAVTRMLFPAVGMVPIQRDVKKASMAALTTAADLLKEGHVVGIYPEGTRSRDGALHRGHTGVAHLALMTGAPIVPVGLIGTERVQPVGARVPRPGGGPVVVRFGEPIDPLSYRFGGSRRRRQQILDDVMAAIAAMTDQPRSEDFATDEPPLIRGGSESVYLVSRHRSSGLSWRQAAERAVDEVCRRYDDARVGELVGFSCRVGDDGELVFDADLALSTRFRVTEPHTVEEITITEVAPADDGEEGAVSLVEHHHANLDENPGENFERHDEADDGPTAGSVAVRVGVGAAAKQMNDETASAVPNKEQ